MFLSAVLIILGLSALLLPGTAAQTPTCSAGSVYRVNDDARVTEVPWDIPVDTRCVDLQRNIISRVRAGAFYTLTQCRSINLGANNISVLEHGAFDGLPELKELDLRVNRLGSGGLWSGVFQALTSLEHLSLEGNDLTEIPAGVFRGLRNLRSLRLSGNRIDVLMEQDLRDLPRHPLELRLQNNPLRCNDTRLCW